MAILDLFSKRKRIKEGEAPEIYTYDTIPQKLKVQIVLILNDTIGEAKPYSGHDESEKVFQLLFEALCREYGRFKLVEIGNGPREQLFNFILQSSDVDEIIDVVELSFQYINLYLKENYERYKHYTSVRMTPDEAISDLNDRFKENGVGYSFIGNEIIRIDSTYMHSEVTKPSISLLWNKKFKGANEEYLKAHEHYRHGRNKECLTEALKAFESSMKIICKEKGWNYQQSDTAKKLIQICFQNNLIPSFTQNQFNSLLSLLESGIPTIRNKLGGHGQGQVPLIVDDEMARYALNITGSNIIFLIEMSGIR